jgi:hypothetical protein
MPPGDSPPTKTAPAPLELVQRFVNSLDLEDGEDELDSPEALRGWLAARDLMGARERVGPADLRRALDVREGLRALLLRNNGLEFDADRVERLDRAAARAGVRVSFSPAADPVLAPAAGGVDGALARLLAIVGTAVADGSWERLRPARARTASGPSTTAPRTAQGAGAGWRSAATSRRRAPSASAGARSARDPYSTV